MPTIAENLQRLVDAKTAIANAITAKGGTVAQGDGLEEYPTAINGIQGGLELNVKFAEGSKEIPDFMFYHIVSGTKKESSKITEVVIGDGITKIGQQAFYRCPITSVKLPNGLKEIGRGAFGHTKLTNVIIPDSVEIIRCSSSRDLAFTGNEVKYENGIGYVDTWVIVGINDTIPQTVEIKSGTRGIAYYAFYQNENMTSITIPNSVIFINGYAFQSCTSLTSITIPNSVTSIGDYAFGSCSALTKITINKPQGSISGAPWGATNATIVWTG